MSATDGSAIAPDIRIDTIPGMSRGVDGRVRGVVVCRSEVEVVRRVLAMVPPAPDGQAAPIYVLDRDGRLPLDSDWGGRVRLFQGPEADAAFLASRRSRIECALPECVATVLDGDAPLRAEIASGLRVLASEQAALAGDLSRELADRAARRGVDWWRDRFAAIVDGSAGRLAGKVLVITSRYSTFIRHSAEDLVASLRRLGHEAILLMEPQDGETCTSIAYLQAIASIDPDLIVQINFPRWMMGPAVPPGWPHVCWVQDAMPHLFQAANAATPLDFVIGHVYREAMLRAGYSSERMLEHPVCVSESKFHRAAARPNLRFDCDVAYVSHRSETPEAFVSRFLRESGLPAHAHPAVHAARHEVDAVISRWAAGPAAIELPGVAASLARSLGRGGDPKASDLLLYRFVRPYAEQLLRHETLDWAAEICRAGGLKLRLFGKGWEEHPTLREFASGPLEHGDDLRQCYQLAAAHLHASIEGCGHQRIAECAMSGGVPLCRRSWADFFYNDWIASREFVLAGHPADVYLSPSRWPAHFVANHVELLQLVRNRDRMGPNPAGWDHTYLQGLYAQVENSKCKPHDAPVPPRNARTLAVFGDPFEATFCSRADLEDRIMKAAERGSWREQMSEGTARRATECVGAARFASRMLDFVSAGLGVTRSLPMGAYAPPKEAVA